jgi:hypothetical protein
VPESVNSPVAELYEPVIGLLLDGGTYVSESVPDPNPNPIETVAPDRVVESRSTTVTNGSNVIGAPPAV